MMAARKGQRVWTRDTVAFGSIPTAMGVFHVVVGPQGVVRIELPGRRLMSPARIPVRGHEDRPVEEGGPRIDAVAAQLTQYLGNRRHTFDLPLDLRGTPFDLSVWHEVGRIPFGQVITYAEIAEKVGRPGAFRAVGAANGRNPIPIVIPCHRVIGSGGRLTGYGGGLSLKARLLRHEGRILSTNRADASTRVVDEERA